MTSLILSFLHFKEPKQIKVFLSKFIFNFLFKLSFKIVKDWHFKMTVQ